jgi:outer membrane protein
MKRFIIILCYVYIASGPVYSGPKEVSLDQCVNIGLQNHPSIMTSQEDQNGAIANYKYAKSRKNIQVNLGLNTVEYLKPEASSNKFNVPGRDTSIGIFAGPTASYNIYDPKRSTSIDAARMSVDLSKMNSLKVQSTLVSNIKKSFYSYGLARETAMMREQLMNKFESKLNRAKLLFKLGQRPVLDITKAEVDLEAARIEYERAKNNEKMTKITLLNSMGITDEDIEFLPMISQELPELKYNIKELFEISENNYPEIKVLKINKEINRINILTEKAAHYPSIDINASVGYENKDFQWGNKFTDNFTSSKWSPAIHAGVSAAMNLYSGGGISARVDGAIAAYNKVLYLEKETLINMRSMIRSYIQDMDVLKRQIEISKLSIKYANNYLKLVKKSYDNGIGSQLEMQDAEMNVMNAELGLISARYYYLITLANLSYVIGIGEEHLCSKK